MKRKNRIRIEQQARVMALAENERQRKDRKAKKAERLARMKERAERALRWSVLQAEHSSQ